MKYKKLLILSHSPNIGGAELALKGLIESIQNDFEITVVIPSVKKMAPSIANSSVNYIYINLPWWCYEAHDKPVKVSSQELMSGYARLKNLANEYDLLLTNTITIPWLGFVANEISKPHIWYVHEFGDIDHNLKFILGYKNSLRIINHVSSRVLTISDAVKQHLMQVIPESKIDIIHQSIDLDRLKNIKPAKQDNKGYRFLCMGAIKPSKGQITAISAIQSLVSKGLNVSLDVVGHNANDTYYHNLLQFTSANIAIEARSFDIVDELSSHDVLLMCSENEALGRVTIEAMAANIPVLGYASPSTAYLLGEKRGLIYTKNTSSSLEKAIETYIANPNIINIKAARKFAFEKYSNITQKNDFESCVSLTANAQEQKANRYFQEYFEILQEKELLSSSTEKLIFYTKRKLYRFVPTRIKKSLKKMLFIY